MNTFRWVYKDFPDLSTRELFDVLELRCSVFIVEQNCPYQDPDKKDLSSYHLLAYDDHGKLAGTLRIVRPGVSYEEASIGRVCTSHEHRKTGLGRDLMKRALEITAQYEWNNLRISAQHYLERFYSDFGFVTQSEPYMEDDIPHVEMLLDRV
jgi:ElaA protein